MKKLMSASIAAFVAAGAMLWNLPASSAETSLNLVSMLPKKHPVARSFGGFITRLNKEFKGEFQIDWRGGPEVVPQF
jgi:hypothetical protein